MDTVITTPMTIVKVVDAGWQYKITARVEWISRDYDVNQISMKKELGTPQEGQTYTCTFERGNLRKYQDGREKDDTRTWNWFWNITQFGSPEPSSASPAPSTGSQSSPSPAFNTQTDINPTTRLNQTATNVRTALMQSIEMGKTDGLVSDTTDTIFERADELFKYMNDRIFGSSPLVQKAVAEGATITSVTPVAEPQAPSFQVPSERAVTLKKDWEVPVSIKDGKEFKEFCLGVRFEMEWVMKKFQEIGISKSADFVSSEQGSYQDLAIILCNLAETEKIANPHKDNVW